MAQSLRIETCPTPTPQNGMTALRGEQIRKPLKGFKDSSSNRLTAVSEGVICRLQVAGCRSNIIIIITIIMIIIMIITIIIITIIIIIIAEITANLREYKHLNTYALMNVHTGYECPSPKDSSTDSSEIVLSLWLSKQSYRVPFDWFVDNTQ